MSESLNFLFVSVVKCAKMADQIELLFVMVELPLTMATLLEVVQVKQNLGTSPGNLTRNSMAIFPVIEKVYE